MSNQQLDNSFSLDLKLGDLGGDGDLDTVTANLDGKDCRRVNDTTKITKEE